MKQAVVSAPAARLSVLSDFVELTKPRIAVLALCTVWVGAALAGGGSADGLKILHVLAGMAFVAGGASALNHWLERGVDARMERTRNRPLPAGRIAPAEAFAFGAILVVAGTAYLAATVGAPAAGLALAAAVAYAFVYTPLKRVTTLNTLVGAIPGAMPPLVGWAAVRGTVDPPAWLLFAIMFLWQFPHFLAIAWKFRDDYAAADLKMLPVVDGRPGATGRQALNYALALLPVSLLPAAWGMAGPLYFAGAMALGLGFLASSARFAREETTASATALLRASIVYLPAVLVLLVIDGPGRF